MERNRPRVTSDTREKLRDRLSFLRRLRSDVGGNTLAIVGAALVPLTGMIGSGVDLSRAYMARTRLQSACDAASLAARRAMTGDNMTDAVRAEATKFFNFNFPQELYETAEFTPTVTKPEPGTVHIEAETTIPTVIMHMFGFDTLPINVECEASQSFVNTDIVLVLDVTGSMLQDVNGHDTSVVANQKITALKEAVLAFYDELKTVQDELAANGMRLRYSILPYSSGVNVGKLLYQANTNYIVNNWSYESRQPIYDTTTSSTVNNQTRDECNARRVPRSPSSGYPATETTTTRESGSSTRRDCYVTQHSYSLQGGTSFYGWLYGEITWDVAAYKASVVNGTPVPTPTRQPFTESNATSTWAGCIEERDTTSTITSSSGYAVPDTALDLNIDLIPTTDANRWRPYWPEVIYRPDNGSHPQVACPNQAARLKSWTRDELNTYLNALAPTGGTYHDNGMIWAARLISAGGVFADSPTTYNNMPVAKHIVFMTDGVLDTGNTLYSTYGMEQWDRRVTGGYTTEADQIGRHRQRFRMMCNTVRGMGAEIWVVAFAVAAENHLQQCVGDGRAETHVKTSSNKTQLINQFKEIGKNIGALRLTG